MGPTALGVIFTGQNGLVQNAVSMRLQDGELVGTPQSVSSASAHEVRQELYRQGHELVVSAGVPVLSVCQMGEKQFQVMRVLVLDSGVYTEDAREQYSHFQKAAYRAHQIGMMLNEPVHYHLLTSPEKAGVQFDSAASSVSYKGPVFKNHQGQQFVLNLHQGFRSKDA